MSRGCFLHCSQWKGAGIKWQRHQTSLQSAEYRVMFLNRKRFDTARAHSEATKMVEFIMALPLSAVVFGVVKDDSHKYAHTAALKSAMVQTYFLCFAFMCSR